MTSQTVVRNTKHWVIFAFKRCKSTSIYCETINTGQKQISTKDVDVGEDIRFYLYGSVDSPPASRNKL